MKGIKIKVILLIAILTACLSAYSQTNNNLIHQRDSLSAIIKKENKEEKLAYLYNELAYKNYELKDYDQLINAAETSLTYSKQKNIPDLIYDNNLLIARAYSLNNNPEDAIKRFLSAKSSIDKSSANKELIESDIDTEIGLIYFNRKHYQHASENFEKALKTYISQGEFEKIKQNTNLLAVCYYLTNNYEKSAEYYQQLLDIYQQEENYINTKQTLKRLADVYQKIGKYDKALQMHNKLYELCNQNNDTQAALDALSNKAFCQTLSGNTEEGIDTYNQLLEADETYSPQNEHLADTYTSIGVSYQRLGKYEECYKYLTKAADLYKKSNKTEDYSRICNILSLIYLQNKDLHNADIYGLKAVESAELSGRPHLQQEAYYTYNQVLQAKGEYDNALSYYKKYLQLHESEQMQQILAEKELNEDLKKLEETEKKYSKELVDAEINELTTRQLQLLADAQKRENELLNKDLALKELERNRMQQELALARQQQEALKREKEISDLQKQRELDEMELQRKTAQENEHKKEIELLESEREKQSLLIDKQKAERATYNLIFVVLSIIVAAFMVVFLVVRKKNRKLNEQKAEIEMKNADLTQKNKEITVQKENLMMANNEIMSINEEISRQKEIIENKNKSITDSIIYAKRIQQAVCPPPEFLNNYKLDYFLFFRPKEIVSGDFYWFYHEGDNIFAVAADCTGHGVPGAFMSMLGNSLLNKIISERKIFQPSVILNNLREEVKKALHQETVDTSERKDGMDLSMAKINTKTLLLEFAAANNNGFLVRNYPKDQQEKANADMDSRDFVEQTENGYKRMITLRADKMPIGVYARDTESFTQKNIQLQSGDTIYLTSDGYIDQFGGQHGRKFLAKNFAQMLSDINDMPMQAQKDKIIDTHEKWIGDTYPQIDDIIVFGLKIL